MQNVFVVELTETEIFFMKTKMFLSVLAALALVSGFNAQAQNKDITVWIPAEVGTLVGGGYVSPYLTNIHAKTVAREDSTLRRTIIALDSLGMVSLHGFGLLPAAVSWQADVPIRQLVVQQSETGLSYGELLLANLIASESKQTLDQVVAERAEVSTWGELMEQLHVSRKPIIGKANFAAAKIRDAEMRVRQSRGRALRDSFPGAMGGGVH